MNRGINVISNNLLTDKHGVLVVVALPSHETNENILAQANFTIANRRSVGQNLAFLHALSLTHHRHLINASSLIRPHKFGNFKGFHLARIIINGNLIRANALHNAIVLRKHANTRIHASLVLHARANNRRLRLKQRHGLPLHIRSHQSTVCVVILQKRNHRSCHRHNHPRTNIHIIGSIALNFHKTIAIPAVNLRVHKMALFVKGFIRLHHDEFVFHIGRHIDNLRSYHSSRLIDLSKRSLNKAIFVDPRKRRQIRNQANVRSFRGLNRTHAAIMAIVNVTNLKTGSISRKSTRSQSRKPPLVGQLGQRVRLIHKLRQLRQSKKLLNSRHNRPNVYQRLRCQHLQILRLKRHSLTNNPLQPRQSDPKLILQQLTNRPNAPISQMINIICHTNAASKAIHIINRRKNVVNSNIIRNKLSQTRNNSLFKLVVRTRSLQNLHQNAKPNLLLHAAFGLRVKINVVTYVHHAIRNHLNLAVLVLNISNRNAGILDLASLFKRNRLTRIGHNLASSGVNNRFRYHPTRQPARDPQLLIVFIPPHPRQIVSSLVKKQSIQMCLSAVQGWRLCGPQLAIQLQKGLFRIIARVLLNRS